MSYSSYSFPVICATIDKLIMVHDIGHPNGTIALLKILNT